MYNTNGLNNEEVKESRKKYGSNRIEGKTKNSFFSLFIETLGDPIIKILLIALIVKIFFLFKDFDYFETIGIVLAILVSSIISTISEYGSNKAFQRMQEESSRINVLVKRNNIIMEISIDDIVVGDIIILSSGNKVPADGILIKGKLSVDESTLNGETREIYKEYTSDINKVNDNNRVYRGTTIYDGKAEVLVIKVGMNTMYGKMAKVLTEEEDISPLKIRLTKLAKTISKIGYIAAIMIAIAYLFNKIFISNNFNIELIKMLSFNKIVSYILEAMTLAVSVLVMSVPEGLPMMITLVLSTNSKKMLKDNVLVRKMVGIETSGSLNILFTDKTGTITKGKMEVINVVDGDMNIYTKNIPNKLKILLEDSIIYNTDSEIESINNTVVGGNLTDKALLTYINKKKNDNIVIKNKISFNSKNKYSISVIEKDNKKIKLIKGAPEIIIKDANYYLDSIGNKKSIKKEELLELVRDKTKDGLRAVAISISESIYPIESIKRNILIGIVFLKDDIRKEAFDGVKLIKDAGIQIVMVTGDSKDTAKAIGTEVGILEEDDIIMTSVELNELDETKLIEIFPKLRIVARAMPDDKKKLVLTAKKMGLVTGMTGDGINDSIALKKADVSFAMGSGTEVAKEASNIVILDDNIMSISKAILYGRTIFKNIRKFIIFQLTVNITAILLSLIGPFIGFPTPITVIQMLWINMVMDTLAGLSFSYESPRVDYMREKPKKKDENIINKYMFNEIIVSSVYSLILLLLFLKLPFFKNIIDSNHYMTAFFSLFIFIIIFNAFNARTNKIDIFTNLKENKIFIFIMTLIFIIQILIIYFGKSLFNTTSLSINELIYVICLALTIIPIDLFRKLILKRVLRRNLDI